MTNRKKYEEMTNLVNETFGTCNFTDPCVDAQNCGYANDNSEEFWAAMICSFNDSVAQRLLEVGLDPAKVGIKY